MGVTVTKDIADLLYMALVTDTMCFRTYDTTQQSFLTAAELAGYGADIAGIGRRNMFIKSKRRIALEELLKKSFHFSVYTAAKTARARTFNRTCTDSEPQFST